MQEQMVATVLSHTSNTHCMKQTRVIVAQDGSGDWPGGLGEAVGTAALQPQRAATWQLQAIDDAGVETLKTLKTIAPRLFSWPADARS